MTSIADLLAGPAPRAKADRTGMYRLYDNFIGIDDGVTTPGERLGAGINGLGSALLSDPVGAISGMALGVKDDLDYLMFQGGAEREPERVLGYAAAPMAPGAVSGSLFRRTPNQVNAYRAYHGSPHNFDKFDIDYTPNGYHFFSNDKGYSERLAGRSNLSRRTDGSMYDVDLDINNPLVVDVPNAAKKELADAGIDISDLSPQEIENAWIGGDNFESLVDFYEGDMRAGNHDGMVFRDTYDGFSRPTDQIVVFDDNLINIVRKYGIAGAAAMLGISAQELQAQVGGDEITDYLQSIGAR